MTLGKADSLDHDENDHDEVRRIAVEPLRTQNAGNHRPDNAAQCDKKWVDAHDKRALLSAEIVSDQASVGSSARCATAPKHSPGR